MKLPNPTPNPLTNPIGNNNNERHTTPFVSSTATQGSGVERAGAIEASAEMGNRRLRAYLAADPVTRTRFDQAQGREILADCDSDHRVANELAGDPIYERVQRRRDFEAWLVGEDE